MNEMQERVDDYFAMGVEHIWVIDPRVRNVYVADVNGIAQPVTEELVIAGTPIRVSTAVLFKQINELEGAS